MLLALMNIYKGIVNSESDRHLICDNTNFIEIQLGKD